MKSLAPYRAAGLLLTIAVVALFAGCARDESLRSPEVKTVTHYGRTLDEQASPQEVAYVLLRAMRDDFLADSSAEREKALDVQFDVAAANVLRKLNRSKGMSDAAFLDRVVRHWTPIVGHYIENFDFTWDAARSRLQPAVAEKLKVDGERLVTTNVLMELQDPSGDPNASVVLIIRLVQDGGYWRVYKLEYDHRYRSLEEIIQG